ncbi:ABC transporter substrate binding protein [Desulfococcaceae bacterium HSG9]|nr:ABC transporter substrate binding protein [Desulfococcaceae bacterium HSG9]
MINISKKTILLLIVLFSMTLMIQPAIAESKYRIGYIEGGPFWLYLEIMDKMKENLEEMGWGHKIEFPADLHFSPGWANKTELQTIAQEMMKRKNIDLIIAGGTGATAALLKFNNKRTPLMSIAVADPIRSGFVVDEKDSGIDNYTTRVDPQAYQRMFRIFHDVVGFKKLGIMYSDLPNGRTIANVDDAYKVAKKRDFEIIEYVYDTKRAKTEKPEDIGLEGLQKLVDKGMDAFFIPALTCFDWTKSDVRKLMDFLIQHKIPTFARNGVKEVKAGALMGFSSMVMDLRGKFFADKVIRILKSEQPRSLPMEDNAVPKISINLSVATQIGFDPSVEILGASDEIFNKVTLPKDRLVK